MCQLSQIKFCPPLTSLNVKKLNIRNDFHVEFFRENMQRNFLSIGVEIFPSVTVQHKNFEKPEARKYAHHVLDAASLWRPAIWKSFKFFSSESLALGLLTFAVTLTVSHAVM